MNNFKAAIFDLDGTLINSMPFWNNLGHEFLKKKGKIPPDNLFKILKTMNLPEASKYFIDNFNLNLSVEEVISEINTMIIDKYKYEINLKEYVKEYLKKIRSKNIKMCVVTAADKELCKIVLTRLKILEYFEFILTCGETNMSKNNPEIYIKATKMLGYEIENIIIFEDSLHCIKAAKDAGFYVVGVHDKSANEDEKEIKLISDVYIKSFKTLCI